MGGRDARWLLILAAVATVAAWQFPMGRQVLYPFTLLATYAHEMGHGLTARILGGDFRSLAMYPDGSGLAEWSGDLGRAGAALVSAGGLLGPSIAGSIVLVISRRPARAPLILIVMGALLGLSALVYARTPFGVAFILATAAFLVGVARWAPPAVASFLVQLVGVQLCLAVFRDVDYMFSAGAVVGGVKRLSDSAVIAEALVLPYWFWGALVALTAFAVLALGLWAALRAPDPT